MGRDKWRQASQFLNHFKMEISNKEDLAKYVSNGALSAGKLMEFIQNHDIPYDAPVLIQRIEDKYFDGVDISGMRGCQTTEDGIFPAGSTARGWGVYLKEGETYYNAIEFNEAVKNGEFVNMQPVKIDDNLKDQYHPAWSCVYYKEDPDILFIDMHY